MAPASIRIQRVRIRIPRVGICIQRVGIRIQRVGIRTPRKVRQRLASEKARYGMRGQARYGMRGQASYGMRGRGACITSSHPTAERPPLSRKGAVQPPTS